MRTHVQREMSSYPCSLTVVLGSFLVGISLLLLLACGSGTSSSQNPNPQPRTTALQVNLGDAPSDRLVAVSMTLGSMALTNSNGGSVTVVSSSTPVEMMHLMGTVEPISLMNVPQGTYSGASISIASAVVMYMDPSTMQLVQKSVSGPMPATINFSPSLTVGSSPMVLEPGYEHGFIGLDRQLGQRDHDAHHDWRR